MRTGVLRSSAALLIALLSANALAESLSDYVKTCKSELEFSSSDMPASVDCTTAPIFGRARPDLDPLQTQTNDAVGYWHVTNSVDLVFACRWLQNGKFPGDFSLTRAIFPSSEFKPPFVAAASVELLIHNRSSGKTCYFGGKTRTIQGPGGKRLDAAPVVLVPPTASNAGDYWSSPSTVDTKLPCADCHSAGPYVITPRISYQMALFGLVNDGHDVRNQKYQAVGSTFARFNDMMTANLSSTPCANACHTVAGNSMASGVSIGVGETVIPSIREVIDVNGEFTDNISVSTSGVMPPHVDPYSEYRWVNRDDGNGGNGDYEQLAHVKDEHPQFYCQNPVDLEAHVVGVDHYVSTANLAMLPNKLEYFNLREGLVCKNSRQPSGTQCNNYQTQYLCGDTWTGWTDSDPSGGGNGDFEERSKVSLPCSKPKAIQAKTRVFIISGTSIRTQTVVFNGPDDRLNKFDNKTGLICANADQVDGGKCSNYVVRYICP